MCQHNRNGKLCLGCKLDKAIETGKKITQESALIREIIRKKNVEDLERKIGRPRGENGDLSNLVAGNS